MTDPAGAPGVEEDDLLPLSALSHLVFCDRRAALIHLERVWADNAYTVEGQLLHEAVDEKARRREVRRELIIARGLHLRALALGVAGIADVVEFHRDDDGAPLPARAGRWRPFPVEYKRGAPKPDDSDVVQICGQALALEEMLGVEVPEGAMFYGRNRRRFSVRFDEPLRATTREAARRLRALFDSGGIPLPRYSARCEGCSLKEICQPTLNRGSGILRSYLAGLGKVK